MATGSRANIREALIESGIHELSIHGIQDFSVRRVAADCGISCAAPYKHFDGKNDFIAAIIMHVSMLWEERIPKIIERYPDDVREQLTEISVEYVNFLVENSHFRSIIMLKEPSFDSHYLDMRLRLSATSKNLILRYCEQVGMPETVMALKLYIVRSLIYGAALMFDNGEMEYNVKNMEYVRHAVRREFDLP